MTIIQNNLLTKTNNGFSASNNKERNFQLSKKPYNPSFGADLSPVSKLGHFLDWRRNLNGMNDSAGFLVCLTSVLGFGVGGPALIYDYFYKKRNHINNVTGDKNNQYGHFESATKIGKIGLRMNQMALTVSGFGGAMTGFSMGVPLMAAGEFIGNIVAAPIINTPTGYGLLNIGLAAIFGGRAFDSDPSHKANMAMFMSKKTIGEKTSYVLNNMGGHLKGAATLSIQLFKHLFGFLSPNAETRKAAIDFFHYKMFRVKSSTIAFTQNIKANGEIGKVETKLKGNTSLLLVASSLLALTGVFMIATEALKKIGVLKTDKVTKAGFTAGKIGQVFDNAGIMTYGLERCYAGNVSAGIPTVASAATMIAGAPNADNDFGKGLTWGGLAFFFLFLAAERFQNTNTVLKRLSKVKEFKALEAKLRSLVDKNSPEYKEIAEKLAKLKKDGIFAEAEGLVRQFEFDFSGIIPSRQLKNVNTLYGNSTEDSFVTLRKLFNPDYKCKRDLNKDKWQAEAEAALRADENPLVKQIPDLVKTVRTKLAGPYDPSHDAAWLKRELKAEGFAQELIDRVILHQADHANAVRQAIYSNILKFGKSYESTLAELANSKDPVVREVAIACQQDYKALLEVE